MATTPALHHDRHKLTRLAIAAVVAVSVSALMPAVPGVHTIGRVLIGFVICALGFAVPLIIRMLRADQIETAQHVDGLDPGRSLTDLIVFVGSLASLAGVVLMLVTKSPTTQERLIQAAITLATVFSAWLLVHTMFALRYARHWFNAEANCIDYHMQDAPAYSDFLYTAFAVGVSFAISDTDLRTTRMRRIALLHSWLSYLFGTVVIAATINLIAGLAA